MLMANWNWNSIPLSKAKKKIKLFNQAVSEKNKNFDNQVKNFWVIEKHYQRKLYISVWETTARQMRVEISGGE
jgi:hypothetical protein